MRKQPFGVEGCLLAQHVIYRTTELVRGGANRHDAVGLDAFAFEESFRERFVAHTEVRGFRKRPREILVAALPVGRALALTSRQYEA